MPIPSSDQEKYIQELYEAHYAMLERACRNKLYLNDHHRDLIADCLAETFILAYQSYDTLKAHPNPAAWLYKACMNRLIPYAKLLKSRQKHFAYSLDSPAASEAADPIDLADQLSERLAVQEAVSALIERLSPAEKEIYQALFIESLSISQTSQASGLKQGNIRVILSRIRKKAREIYQNFSCF